MKTKNSFTVAIISMLAFILTIGQSFAQTTVISASPMVSSTSSASSLASSAPASLPMLGSQEELAAYGWERVATVVMNGSASPLLNGSTTNQTSIYASYPKTNGVVDLDELFAFVAKQRLTFDVLYPSNTIGEYAYFADSDGFSLFSANPASKVLTPASNGTLTNNFDLVFQMNDIQTITMTNVTSAYVDQQDDYGNEIGQFYISVYYGYGPNGNLSKIQFPGYYSGKHASLILTFIDGTQAAYNLSNHGVRMATVPVSLGVNKVSALGMRTFRNSATAYAQVTDDEFARNISPLGQLVNTTNQWVYFSSWLPERSPGAGHEYATSVYIWQQGQSSTNAIRLDMTSGQLQVPYYITNRVWIRYTYPSGFGQKVNQFGQPYWWYYGGKGG